MAQHTEELRFKSFGIAEGLSQNTVYDIEQSHDGMLWLATIDGLNRFDGSNFRKFTPQDSSLRSFGSVTYAIDFWDDRLLLVGMSKGLLLFDIQTGRFSHPDKIFPQFHISSDLPVTNVAHREKEIFIQLNDEFWVYDLDQQLFSKLSFSQEALEINNCKLINDQLYCFSGASLFKKERDHFVKLALSNKKNTEIDRIAGDNNHLFVQRSDGVLEHWYLDPYDKPRLIKSNLGIFKSGSSMLYQKKEKLYIGTRDKGIYRYNINTQKLSKSKDNFSLSGLRSNFILDLFEGQDGLVYVGTSGGGFSILLNEIESINRLIPSHVNPNIKDDMVLGIQEDANGNIYMGGLFDGFKVYNPSQNTLTRFSTDELSGEAMNVYDFKIMQDQNILLATWDGLLEYDFRSDSFSKIGAQIRDNRKLYSICEFQDKGIYIGGEQGLHYYDFGTDTYFTQDLIAPGVGDLIIRHMAFLSDDELLLATTNKSLVIYNLEDQSIVYLHELNKYCSSTRHFCIDEQYIYLASDRGLLLLDKTNYEILHIWTTKNDLSNDFIYSTLVDEQGQIWVATNRGLSMINTQDSTVVNYDLIDGLQSYEFNTAAALLGKDGTLLFGGTNGLNLVEIGLDQNFDLLREAILSNIRINSENYDSDLLHNYMGVIKVPYDQNNIFIGYASPYHWTGKLEYSYRFKGEKEWNHNGYSTSINYSGLAPGNYTIELKTSIGNRRSINADLFSFEITPAWWQTWIFKCIVLVGLLGLTYLIVSIRAKRKQEVLEVENTIMQLENRMLRYRMNPHFIFNTLNSIKYHALFKSKEETSEYITEFSQIIRGILEYNSLAFLSLKDDIDWIRDYLKIEQKRFKNGFDFEIIIDPKLDIEEGKIPPLLLQPFIENAIWHGILHSNNSKKISLHYTRTPAGYQCILEDNGVGRVVSQKLNSGQKMKKQSLGISITDQRIENINKKKELHYSYTIEDLYDRGGSARGTKVILLCEYADRLKT